MLETESAASAGSGVAAARAAVRRADRRALLLIGAFVLVSLAVQGATLRSEAERTNSPITWQETWLLEATSHGAILLIAPLLPLLLDRFPLRSDDWLRAAPAHLFGVLGFSVLHVATMLAARRLLFESVVGYGYGLNLFAPANFLYELRKDALTYAMLLVGFVLMRSIELRRLEAESALQTARREHKLTLRSGSTAFVVDAGDVLWARSAANYVEVATPGRTYLARMTLTRLEALLRAAGHRHVRVHRSYVIDPEQVREVIPAGDGDVRLTLSDGTVAPGSRRYRDRLLAAIDAAEPSNGAARGSSRTPA